ncbi:hypothetical protein FRC11_003460, partial [Ceratobasidium sp. 423]
YRGSKPLLCLLGVDVRRPCSIGPARSQSQRPRHGSGGSAARFLKFIVIPFRRSHPFTDFNYELDVGARHQAARVADAILEEH